MTMAETIYWLAYVKDAYNWILIVLFSIYLNLLARHYITVHYNVQ